VSPRWSRILLATLCLLTLATSVHAECAWVLWESNPLKDGGQWGYARMGLEFLLGTSCRETTQGTEVICGAVLLLAGHGPVVP
jgi:hypothetical protein